jgi:hypothetical protein
VALPLGFAFSFGFSFANGRLGIGLAFGLAIGSHLAKGMEYILADTKCFGQVRNKLAYAELCPHCNAARMHGSVWAS